MAGEDYRVNGENISKIARRSKQKNGFMNLNKALAKQFNIENK